ncbi:hypothetical protein KUTeg_012767 [Tegillarca granosa]|uniref:Uncharacterized protein n=1 Tax=Tegillarca granosa TaxID=220873 RepID=A0ABQ9F4S6_TEGGR|nr:hypothetical protein KUTeg_012767 [Tegillarca granosa]
MAPIKGKSSKMIRGGGRARKREYDQDSSYRDRDVISGFSKNNGILQIYCIAFILKKIVIALFLWELYFLYHLGKNHIKSIHTFSLSEHEDHTVQEVHTALPVLEDHEDPGTVHPLGVRLLEVQHLDQTQGDLQDQKQGDLSDLTPEAPLDQIQEDLTRPVMTVQVLEDPIIQTPEDHIELLTPEDHIGDLQVQEDPIIQTPEDLIEFLTPEDHIGVLQVPEVTEGGALEIIWEDLIPKDLQALDLEEEVPLEVLTGAHLGKTLGDREDFRGSRSPSFNRNLRDTNSGSRYMEEKYHSKDRRFVGGSGGFRGSFKQRFPRERSSRPPYSRGRGSSQFRGRGRGSFEHRQRQFRKSPSLGRSYHGSDASDEIKTGRGGKYFRRHRRHSDCPESSYFSDDEEDQEDDKDRYPEFETLTEVKPEEENEMKKRDLAGIILRLLMDEGGHMKVHDLEMELITSKNIQFSTSDDFEKFLSDNKEVFKVHTIEVGDMSEVGEKSVTGHSKIMICQQHSKYAGSCKDEKCDALHLCKYRVLSDCTRRACVYGHDVRRNLHNKKVLRDHMLHRLSFPQLQQMFRNLYNRQGINIPRICSFYNSENGCRGEYRNKINFKPCPFLHICKKFIDGEVDKTFDNEHDSSTDKTKDEQSQHLKQKQDTEDSERTQEREVTGDAMETENMEKPAQEGNVDQNVENKGQNKSKTKLQMVKGKKRRVKQTKRVKQPSGSDGAGEKQPSGDDSVPEKQPSGNDSAGEIMKSLAVWQVSYASQEDWKEYKVDFSTLEGTTDIENEEDDSYLIHMYKQCKNSISNYGMKMLTTTNDVSCIDRFKQRFHGNEND